MPHNTRTRPSCCSLEAKRVQYALRVCFSQSPIRRSATTRIWESFTPLPPVLPVPIPPENRVVRANNPGVNGGIPYSMVISGGITGACGLPPARWATFLRTGFGVIREMNTGFCDILERGCLPQANITPDKSLDSRLVAPPI
jgi:hypothetical protein